MIRLSFRAMLLIALGLPLAATIGCDRASTPQRAAADTGQATPAANRSPVETIQRINALRWDRDYDAMAELMTAQHRPETIRYLESIDRLMDAHDALQAEAAARFGDRIHHAWNIHAVRNNLGVFSRDIRIISQTHADNRVEVTLQQADRVPLIHATLVQENSQWKLVPPIGDTSICSSLDAFAARMDDVAKRIRAGLSPEGYFNAVTGELLPDMVRIAHNEPATPTRFTDATPADEP